MDPAWDMPFWNYQQSGSFQTPIAAPAAGPDAGTLVQLPCVNRDWLLLIMGCLDQLRNPSSWVAASSSALDTILGQVTKLQEMVWSGMDVPCCNVQMQLTAQCELQYSVDGGSTWTTVMGWDANLDGCIKAHVPPQQPFMPPAQTQVQNACGIAAYLSLQIQQQVFKNLANIRQAVGDVNQFISAVIADITAFAPVLAFISGPMEALFVSSLPYPYTDFQDAYNSAALWQDVTCAIYGAISGVGYVNSANFAAVASAIAGVSYVHAEVPPGLANLWTHLGLQTIQTLQAEGANYIGDCSTCGSWCIEWDFRQGPGGTTTLQWAQIGSITATLMADGWHNSSQCAGADQTLAVHVIFPQAITITGMFVWWQQVSGVGPQGCEVSGFNRVEMWHSGSHVNDLDLGGGGSSGIYKVGNGAFGSPAVVDELKFLAEQPTDAHDIIFQTIQLLGTGENPFGTGNCVRT